MKKGYLTDEWDELRNQTTLAYQDIAVDANDTKLRISQLTKKTDPKGTATATPTTDYQWSFAYDASGNLLSATDPEGFATTQTYNANGTVATSVDANSRTTTFVAYDANGLPTEIRDAKAQTTRLSYDADGLLRSVQDPLHQSDAGALEREYKAVMDYDSFHRLGRQSAPKSTALERGKLIWSGADYDPNDNIVVSLAPDYAPGGGDRTTIAYDPMDRQTLATGPDTSVDAAGERTQFEYDEAGRLLRVTAPKGVLTPAVADDFLTEYTYDLLDRVVTEARKAGTEVLRTHICYDLAGDLRWLVAPKAALGTAPTDCSGTPPANTARAAYDDAHRLLTATDPLGRVRSVGYDANGAAVSSTDEDGTQETRSYNQRGQLVKVVRALEKDAGNLTTRPLTSVLEYDPAGSLKREISPRAWDASADKITFTDYVTEYFYDELGRVTRVALPKDATTIAAFVHRAYDANGNLTMTSLPSAKADPVATPLTAEEKTLVSYFDTGWVESSNDPANPKAHFDYTAEGWQASRTPEKVGAPGELDTTQQMLWDYFADGQRKRQTDRKGLGSSYSYDANNNLTAAEEGQGVVDATESPFDIEAVYDGFDRQTKVRQKRKIGADWTFTTSAYDLNGNITVREDDGVETTAGALVTAGQRNEFVYDAADQVLTHTDFGRLTGTTDDRRITSGYFPQGWEQSQLVEKSDGAGGWTQLQRTDSSYLASGDLRTLVTKNGAGAILETHTLAYEDTLGRYLNGNRARDVFQLLGPNLGQPCRVSDCTTSYAFDAQERLVEEKLERGGAPVVSTFQVDPAGNVEKEWLDGVLKATSVYTGSQLTKVTAQTSVSNFFYDSDGNIDCQTSGTIVDPNDCNTPAGGTPSTRLTADYSYDHLNRLAAFRGYDGTGLKTTSGYTADAFDRVVSQTDTATGNPAKKTLFSYLGLSGEVTDERHETAGALQTTKSYSYDAFGRRSGMSDTPAGGSAATYTFGRNVHGDVSLLVNAAGQAQAAYGYRAYGAEDGLSKGDTTTNPLNPFRFNDKRWDSGSGSLDMGARRFSPDIGRFIQRDMYNDALGDLDLATDTLTGNRYSFAGGNPISYVELDGHIPVLPGLGGGLGGGNWSNYTSGDVRELFIVGCYMSFYCGAVMTAYQMYLRPQDRSDPFALIASVPTARLGASVRASGAATRSIGVAVDLQVANRVQRRVTNTRRDHLTYWDLKNARRESRGNPLNPSKPMQHVLEVREGQTSLLNMIGVLDKRMTKLSTGKRAGQAASRAEIEILLRLRRRTLKELYRSYRHLPPRKAPRLAGK